MLDLRSLAFGEAAPGPSVILLPLLDAAEAALPALLTPENRRYWRGVLSTEDGQSLRRLACDVTMDGVLYTILLHQFERDPERHVSRHFHPWPLAAQIIEGEYRMNFGPGRQGVFECTDTLELKAGDRYRIDPDVWHSIEPMTDEIFSLAIRPKIRLPMVEYRRYAQVAMLDPSASELLFTYFSSVYRAA